MWLVATVLNSTALDNVCMISIRMKLTKKEVDTPSVLVR